MVVQENNPRLPVNFIYSLSVIAEDLKCGGAAIVDDELRDGPLPTPSPGTSPDFVSGCERPVRRPLVLRLEFARFIDLGATSETPSRKSRIGSYRDSRPCASREPGPRSAPAT